MLTVGRCFRLQVSVLLCVWRAVAQGGYGGNSGAVVKQEERAGGGRRGIFVASCGLPGECLEWASRMIVSFTPSQPL